MNFKLPTPENTWEGVLGLMSLVLLAFKKEILDWFKEGLKKSSERFTRPSEVVRIQDARLKAVIKTGLAGLDLVLWQLLNEYEAQRVTVTKYKNVNGIYLATCVSEALAGEMPAIARDLQESPVDSSIWDEIERIHRLPGRKHYVPDAQLVDIVAMRDALLNTNVWSAYYQSLPTSKGKPWALLAISWSKAHPVSESLMGHLHSSGVMCSTVLLIMEQAKPTESA